MEQTMKEGGKPLNCGVLDVKTVLSKRNVALAKLQGLKEQSPHHCPHF